MANRRRKQKNTNKAKRNIIQNKNRGLDTRDGSGNTLKKEHIPNECSNFTVKSGKCKKEYKETSSSQSKIIRIIGNGFFGRKCDDYPVKINGKKCLVTFKNKINVNPENWKIIKYSGYNCNSITKRNKRFFILLKSIVILRKDCLQDLNMEKFLVFNKVNFVQLSYFFLIQNITVGNLNFHKTLIRSKSLKNRPLFSEIFENIIKEDRFTLFNRKKGLSYSIILKNSYRSNASQENIYFTLHCRKCNNSSYICQSLDTLFSFTEPKHKRLCDINKNQQNYLSLIYNGCFFPILNVRNCHKCSPVNFEDNIQKTNIFKNSPIGKAKNLSGFTSNLQVNTPVKKEGINSNSSIDFISQESANTCIYGFLTPLNIINSNSTIRHHDLRNNQLERNVLDDITNQNYIPSFNSSKFSASQNSLVCSSKLCDFTLSCKCVCTAESNQICDEYVINSTFSPYVNSNILCCNCIRCLDSASYNLPLVTNGQNLIKGYYTGNIQPADGNTINMNRVLANANISGIDDFLHGKPESHSIENDRPLNEDPCSRCNVNYNCIDDIYSPHANPLIGESKSISEISNSAGTKKNSDVLNETTETDIHPNVFNQCLKLSYKNYEDCLGHSDYVGNQIDLRESLPFPNKNSFTVYSNLDSCPNKIEDRVNHNSGLDCENCLGDLQKWKCSQSFRSNNNYLNDIGYIPTNIYVPLLYSNAWTPPVSDVEAQSSIEICHLDDVKELDSVSKSKSLARTQCVLLDENEDMKRVNRIREKNRMSANKHDKYSNTSELKRENHFPPKHLSKIELPKNMESELHSYTEARKNSVSECEILANDSNIYTSNSQQCNMIYDPRASDPSRNIIYNTRGNESINKNPSVCDKPEYGDRSTYKTTSDNFYKANLSQYIIYPKEYKFSSCQPTYPRGKNLNVMDNNNYYRKPTNKLINHARFGEAPKYYSNNSQRIKPIFLNTFKSSLEFPVKFRENNFQEYRKQEPSLFFNSKHFLSKTFPSKANLPEYKYMKDKYSNYSHHEYKSRNRGMFNYSQEEFFNAAANPNSYTY